MCLCLFILLGLSPPSPLPSPGLMSVPDKGTVLLSSPSCPLRQIAPNAEIQRLDEAELRPSGLKKQTGQQRVHFPFLGVASGVADGLGQPGACCPGNSPAPPLLIGCRGGSQPRFKGTPAIALWKTYPSHCGWRNKWSFSSSLSFLSCRDGGWVGGSVPGGPLAHPPGELATKR